MVKRCEAEEVAELGGWGCHVEVLCWYKAPENDLELDETMLTGWCLPGNNQNLESSSMMFTSQSNSLAFPGHE